VRQAGRLADAALIAMAMLAGFSYVVAIDGLVTESDALRTTQDIAASIGTFRAGVICLALVAALDVVVAWALGRFFAPARRGLAVLAAWLRVLYAGVFAVAIAHLYRVVGLLGDATTAGSLTESLPVEVMAAAARFTTLWDVGLILFGLHLLAIAWLAYWSGYVARLLAVLVGIAGVGYVVDSLGALLAFLPSTSASSVTFVGELVLALWLLARAHRVELDPRPPGGATFIDVPSEGQHGSTTQPAQLDDRSSDERLFSIARRRQGAQP